MLFKLSSFSLALAALASAQNSQTPDLAGALSSQNDTLSSLSSLLQSQQGLLTALGQTSNITILAPSNDALKKFMSNSSMAQMMGNSTDLITALLQYHVLNGTYYASNVTQNATFIPTLLTNSRFTNVTGGQRVGAKSMGGNVTIYSALGMNSSVSKANVNFTGGTIHVIDTVLTLPTNISNTFRDANLTAASGAVAKADLGMNLTMARDLTIFAPNNEAFNAIGNLVGNLSTSNLSQILEYHVVSGMVDYSSLIKNGSSVQTLNGDKNLTITVMNGTVYVNSAKVVLPDLLTENGVVHVIDAVLNPSNSTAKPDPSAKTPVPAFSGAATSSGGTPFTSGQPTPTGTVPTSGAGGSGSGGSGGSSSSTSKGAAAAPMRTAAVGAAALFGGAAVLVNM